MEIWAQHVITFLCAVLASSGFWAWIMKRSEKRDAGSKMLKGLGHDRIMTLGRAYIERGWITVDEYENLSKYLYGPYTELHGNGSAEKIMHEVEKLPIRSDNND